MTDYTELVDLLREDRAVNREEAEAAADAIEALQERAERAEAEDGFATFVCQIERRLGRLEAAVNDRLAAIEARLPAPGHGPLTEAERKRLFGAPCGSCEPPVPIGSLVCPHCDAKFGHILEDWE